ncbi:MAG: cupin domain-containing protein [Planctomycetaceae bacterium]|nr:cupin domain-containing protein [Planctomycetaceae bacterium]
MKTRLTIALLMTAALLSGCAQQDVTKSVQLLPGDLQWKSSPALHSLQTATLLGDPAKPAPYVQRIKLPPNHRLEPHSHPNSARIVTVLSGTMYFAYGNAWDESRLRALPPGSFFTEPANMPHFARTGNEEVILQLSATGPDGTRYISGPLPTGHGR